MRAAMLSAAALVALAACDPVGVARQAPDCVRLLQNYDRAEAAFGNSGSRDRLVLPPAIEQTAQRARQGGVGLPVRSRGAPGLGRRIFIGPFDTEGGLAEGMEVARRAGFVAPYVRRF